MTRIVVLGVTLTGNRGGEAMLVGLLQNLPRYVPEAVFDLFSVYGKADLQAARSDALRVRPVTPVAMLWLCALAGLYAAVGRSRVLRRCLLVNKNLRAVVEADLVVDMSGISFVDSRRFKLIYNVVLILPAILLGKPVFKYSQAIGPIRTRLNRSLANWLLPKIERVAARGEITAKHLREVGLRNVEICADGAFQLAVGPSAESEASRLIETGLSSVRPVVGISPSTVVESYCKHRGIAYIDILEAFARRLIEDDMSVVFIAHAARFGRRGRTNNDHLICREIYARLRGSERCALIDEDLSAEELRAVIGRTDVVVVSRFHAMISALATSVPPLVIGWGHKYEEALAMFELSANLLPYQDLTLERLVHAFDALRGGLSRQRELIAAHIGSVTRSALRNTEIVAELLGASGVGPTRREGDPSARSGEASGRS